MANPLKKKAVKKVAAKAVKKCEVSPKKLKK